MLREQPDLLECVVDHNRKRRESDDAERAHRRELAAPDSAAAIFQQEWRIYRKMVTKTISSTAKHMRACVASFSKRRQGRSGSWIWPAAIASAAADTLEGTDIASYCGVDLSGEALRLASRALAKLVAPSRCGKGTLSKRSQPGASRWMSSGSACPCIISWRRRSSKPCGPRGG